MNTENNITKLKDFSSVSKQTYSLDCPVLDIPLGGTGLKSGKVVEIRGLESVGKCLALDTYIKTEKGVERIDEVFKRNDFEPTCTNKKKEIGVLLYNEKNELELTKRLLCNCKKQCFLIKTRSGNEIKASVLHPLRVIDENGFIVWKKIQNIKVNDYLVSTRFNKEKEIFNEEEFHEGRLLGYLIADGCFTNNNRIHFTNGNKEIVENFIETLNYLFKIDKPQLHFNKKENCDAFDIHLNISNLSKSYYDKYDLTGKKAKDKNIPYQVRVGSKFLKKTFLQSYLDLDSHVNERGNIEITSASKQLLFEVKQILQLDFGIISFLHEKLVKLENWNESRNYYRLTISGDDFVKYINLIGFGETNNKKKVENFDLYKNCQTNHFEADFYFDKVESKKVIGEIPTFDFEMSKTSSFIANSICSHNSSIAKLFAYSFSDYWMQKGETPKVKVFDTEREFELERTIWQRPDLVDIWDLDEMNIFEEIHEEIRNFLNNAEKEKYKPMIIWDTLASTKTKAQNETGSPFGGGQMEQARVFRWMMRDITPLLAKTDCSLIIPNQTYKRKSKNPAIPASDVSYGGGSILYYSSVRLDMKKIKEIPFTLQDGREIGWGIEVECFTKKNKLFSPHQKFNIVLSNENGLDPIETRINYLTKLGYIKKNASWKSFQYPDKVYDPNGKEDVKQIEIKWQGLGFQRFNHIINNDHPHLKDWMDYLIYYSYTQISPLIKMKIIKKLWEYEKQFLGSQQTELTEKEIHVAKLIEKKQQEQQEKEEKRMMEELSKQGKKTKKQDSQVQLMET